MSRFAHNDRRNRFSIILCLAALALAITAIPAIADKQPPEQPPVGLVLRSAPVTPFVFDGDLRDLPRPKPWKPGDPVKEIPRRFYPAPGEQEQFTPSGITHVDTRYEQQLALVAGTPDDSFINPSRNFPGQGYSGANPPDTAGDVGPAHYIQMINTGGGADVAIYDKAEPTPNLLTTFRLDNIGSGQCASGRGDPIVIYDRLADRWMLSEFSFSGNNLCLYISQTGDPVSGGWFNYAYTAPSFPDYPKYGVWPTDANGGLGSYIVTANDGGPGIYALDRGAMLSGSPGTYQRVTIPGLPGFGFEAPTPADMDGPTAPPTGAAAIIMRHRDTENHSGPSVDGDQLEMWSFDVDWVTPGSSVLTFEPQILTSEFDSDLCGLTSFFCFPQPNSGTTLDPLREVIMNRLQYINHGGHESLVGNLVTDVNGTNLGGVRWFELRRLGGGGWTLHQEGTYSIDDDSRWMAASSMDQSGNIAVAYNISSSTTFPSLRYTGRMADDPLNVMTQPETVIHPGTSPNSSNRYGDYSAMNLDPVDDCTFWFTGMDNTSTNWRTQIVSFRFDACGCEVEPPPLLINGMVAGDNRIDITWNDSTNETIEVYRVLRSTSHGGPYVEIAEVTDTSPGNGSIGSYSYSDTDVSGDTIYYYIVRANDGAACTSPESNEVGVTATGLCTLAPLFAGLQSATTPNTSNCTLDLAWSEATASCAGPIRYSVYRSETPDFQPDIANRVATALSGTTYTDPTELESGVRYYYIVRAVDLSNQVDDGNLLEVSGIPYGSLTTGTWIEDGGDTGEAKMIMETPWSFDGTEGNLGPGVYKTGTYSNLSCTALSTPTLQLGMGSQLSFSTKYEIENSWDKGEVQISTDEGQTWTRLEVGYPGNSTNASDNCGFPTGSYFTGTNLTWTDYSVDLSAWEGQNVRIRFQLSTDTSVTRQGWWIDDITITEVDVPGECVTSGGCEDNPFVSVIPEGPLTLCDGDELELVAEIVNGNGPLDYQWTRDGVDIPGATSPTYLAQDTGTHTYNVQVRAAACIDPETDGSPLVLEWQDKPAFGGLTGVESGLESTCAIELQWAAASTACDGPLTYSIYRDTSSPVDITPDNLIRSGLTTQSFMDRTALEDGTFYFYVVRAIDVSTGQDDGNTVELGAQTETPEDGLYAPLVYDFEDPAQADDWTATPAPSHNCGGWALSSSSTQRPSLGSGSYLLSNNSACAPGETTWITLNSPGVNADVEGIASATLGYDVYYNHGEGDSAAVEVWDGAAWQLIWFEAAADVNSHHEWDVTQYVIGNPAFRARWTYSKAIDDQWYSIDDVFLLVEVDTVCDTDTTPPPVPDGSGLSAPLRGNRTAPDGATLEVLWDVTTCPAAGYKLLHGDLANVADYTLDSAICEIGDSGSYSWDSVPAGDLFFLIVGTDGADVESSWGTNSSGGERNGPSASEQCGLAVKSTTNVCP